MGKRLTIDQMKRNLADPSIWRRVLSNSLAIGLFIAGFFWWPLMIVIYFATQVWKGRRLLFSFRGRLGRRLYWWSVLIVSIWALIGGGVAFGAIQAALPDEETQSSARALWLAAALIPFVIAPCGLCAAAAGVRRLHDCDRSGAWLLALYGVPLAGIGIFNLPKVSDPAHTLVLFLVVLPSALWACVALGFQRGSVGPNRFGPDLVARPANPDRAAAPL